LYTRNELGALMYSLASLWPAHVCNYLFACSQHPAPFKNNMHCPTLCDPSCK